MQLFSATSTALQFLHRTEIANSPLETQRGESASPELQHGKVSWKRTTPEFQKGKATNTCSAPIHHPNQNPGKYSSKKAKIPVGGAQVWLHSPREMLCLPCALSNPGALRNAPKIFPALSQSLALGCRTPQQSPDSPLTALTSAVSVMGN